MLFFVMRELVGVGEREVKILPLNPKSKIRKTTNIFFRIFWIKFNLLRLDLKFPS
jgi:hypothetical protein